MIWIESCSSGKSPLASVDNDIKINYQMYHENILKSVLLLWFQEHMKTELPNKTFKHAKQEQHKNGGNYIYQISWGPRMSLLIFEFQSDDKMIIILYDHLTEDTFVAKLLTYC